MRLPDRISTAVTPKAARIHSIAEPIGLTNVVRRTVWSIIITTARDVPFKRDFAVGNIVGSVRQGRFMAKFPISSLLPYLDPRCASSSMVARRVTHAAAMTYMEKQSPTPALLVQRDTGLILSQNTL